MGGRALRLGRPRGPSIAAITAMGGRTLRLGQTWEVVAWEIPHLGSYHLGKYPLEVAAWENAFGKVPNSLQNIINLT